MPDGDAARQADRRMSGARRRAAGNLNRLAPAPKATFTFTISWADPNNFLTIARYTEVMSWRGANDDTLGAKEIHSMNKRIKVTIGIGLTVLLLVAVFTTAAFAQGPGGTFGRMMGGLGFGGMMGGQGQQNFGGMMSGQGQQGFGGMMGGQGFGWHDGRPRPTNLWRHDERSGPARLRWHDGIWLGEPGKRPADHHRSGRGGRAAVPEELQQRRI